MRIVRANYAEPEVEAGGLGLHDMKVEAQGVYITLTERAGGLSVSIDPVGRDFIDSIKSDDFYMNTSQARIIVRGVKR